MAELAKNVDNGDGAALSTSGDVEGPSLEELQAQLAEMEATQSELASRLQIQSENAEPRLDHRLAAIEEQFRSSFDDRLRAGSGSATFPSSIPARSTSDADLLVINRIFREVSRLMADEWRPVFDILIAGFNEEIVNAAKESLETQPSLIQVRYRPEISTGAWFHFNSMSFANGWILYKLCDDYF
jgi:flagellar motor switch protein FliM